MTTSAVLFKQMRSQGDSSNKGSLRQTPKFFEAEEHMLMMWCGCCCGVVVVRNDGSRKHRNFVNGVVDGVK